MLKECSLCFENYRMGARGQRAGGDIGLGIWVHGGAGVHVSGLHLRWFCCNFILVGGARSDAAPRWCDGERTNKVWGLFCNYGILSVMIWWCNTAFFFLFRMWFFASSFFTHSLCSLFSQPIFLFSPYFFSCVGFMALTRLIMRSN